MPIRTTFATLSSSTSQPLSLFDQEFADFANWVVLPCNASGTNVITLTPQQFVPQLPNYGFYNVLSFLAPNTTSGPVFATFQPLGTLPVYYSNGTTQVGQNGIISGQPYWFQYNPVLTNGSGGFYLLAAAVPPPFGTQSALSGSALGSMVIVNSTTQILVTALQAVIPNATATLAVFRTAISLLNNTPASGPGGLDTGSIASNNWYNIYLIDNGTAPSTLLSLSATSPVLPSGYSYFLRIGAMFYGSSGWLAQQLNGPAGMWTLPTYVANSTGGAVGSLTSPTFVAVQVRNGGQQAVPPTASRIRGFLAATFSDTAMCAPNANYGAISTATQPPCVTGAAAGIYGTINCAYDFQLQSNNIYWATHSTGSYLGALGWQDSVPCF